VTNFIRMLAKKHSLSWVSVSLDNGLLPEEEEMLQEAMLTHPSIQQIIINLKDRLFKRSGMVWIEKGPERKRNAGSDLFN